MVTGLEELGEACRACEPRSRREQIEHGEDNWFTGTPAPASKGTIALAQSASIRLIFREEDILAVHKQGDRYFVRVSAEANMMISHEQVVKAAATHCRCDHDGSDDQGGDKSTVMRRTIGDRVDPDADVNWIEDWGCWWQINCYTVWIPLVGSCRVCIPVSYRCS